MVEVLLRAQLPTLAAVWTLGAKLWTRLLRKLSCLRAKMDRRGHKPSREISAANNSWEEKTTDKPLMASSRMAKHSEATGGVKILAENLYPPNTQGETPSKITERG